MFKALYTAASGMRSQQTQVDVIANNLANVNTAGFKRSDVTFEDLLYVNQTTPGATNKSGGTVSGMQVGSGSQVTGTSKNFAAGNLIQTGKALDLAIAGEGFFELQAGDGTRVFTRDGSFQTDKDGNLTNSAGLKLVPAITAIPAGAQVSINNDGTVTSSVNGTTTSLGQINLSTFTNPSGLEAVGGNVYRPTAASGTPVTGIPGANGVGAVKQGNQERSNVDIATELISLILAQRAYETNSKAITTADEMLNTANQITR